VLMETELWPNLISEAGERGIPAVLVKKPDCEEGSILKLESW